MEGKDLIVRLTPNEVLALSTLIHCKNVGAFDVWDMVGSGNRDILKNLLANLGQEVRDSEVEHGLGGEVRDEN